MSTPDGSSNVSSPNNRATFHNNSSSVSKVTPSPPKGIYHTRDSSLVMPPIDEQAVVSPALQPSQTSVANLIARINAVSRSDPQKALAAIDFIIKREGGGVYGTDQPNVVRGHRGMNAPSSSMDPQETSQNVPIVRRIVDDHRSSSSGLGILGVPANAPTNTHPLGDSDRPVEKNFRSLAAVLPGVREGGEFGNDDNDDSLLSSDECIVGAVAVDVAHYKIGIVFDSAAVVVALVGGVVLLIVIVYPFPLVVKDDSSDDYVASAVVAEIDVTWIVNNN